MKVDSVVIGLMFIKGYEYLRYKPGRSALVVTLYEDGESDFLFIHNVSIDQMDCKAYSTTSVSSVSRLGIASTVLHGLRYRQ